jgi:hypothetical protein
MQLSIRIVVAALVILTSFIAALVALVPPLVQLPNSAMMFVVRSTTSLSDKLQLPLAVQLRTAKRAGDTLYKAASSKDLLTPDGHLNSSTLLAWVGEVVYKKSLTVTLARPDSVAVSVSPYNILHAGDRGKAVIPGCVFVARATGVGKVIEYGYFRASAPHLPLNATLPWSTFLPSFGAADQPIYAKLSNPMRTSPMQWVSLSSLNTSSTTSSLITYGGPFNVSSAVDPLSRKQILSVNLRGETVSVFLNSMTVLRSGTVAIVIDSVSGALFAGSIIDPTSICVNRSTVALVHLAALRDPKIYPILHAVATLLPNSTADSNSYGGIRGSDALLTCELPCLFTHWPHLNELRNGADASLIILFGYLAGSGVARGSSAPPPNLTARCGGGPSCRDDETFVASCWL